VSAGTTDLALTTILHSPEEVEARHIIQVTDKALLAKWLGVDIHPAAEPTGMFFRDSVRSSQLFQVEGISNRALSHFNMKAMRQTSCL
jgi:hypothetical protein